MQTFTATLVFCFSTLFLVSNVMLVAFYSDLYKRSGGRDLQSIARLLKFSHIIELRKKSMG